MKKLFLIPGYTHKISDKKHRFLLEDLRGKYDIESVRIDWKNHVMSDYVDQFIDQYEKKKAKTNYVFGYSFGAMIALITAKQLQPNKLFLCSITPYFSEDLSSLKTWAKKIVGKRRMDDFQKWSAKKSTKGLTVPTKVFYGDREGKKYPDIKARAEKTSRAIKNSKLIIVPNAPHDITHPDYRAAIKRELK